MKSQAKIPQWLHWQKARVTHVQADWNWNTECCQWISITVLESHNCYIKARSRSHTHFVSNKTFLRVGLCCQVWGFAAQPGRRCQRHWIKQCSWQRRLKLQFYSSEDSHAQTFSSRFYPGILHCYQSSAWPRHWGYVRQQRGAVSHSE